MDIKNKFLKLKFQLFNSNKLAEFYDYKFLNGIRYLIAQLKKSNSIDELIIMNDHGPRFRDKYGNILLKFNSGSLIDNNFYGVYFYRIPILKKETNQKNLLN